VVHFYKPLWVGEQAGKKYLRIRYAVKYGIRLRGAYCIILSRQKGELMEIRSTGLPLSSWDSKEIMHVIGLAWGKEEAKELVRQIVDEVYQNTGGVDLVSYLKEKG